MHFTLKDLLLLVATLAVSMGGLRYHPVLGLFLAAIFILAWFRWLAIRGRVEGPQGATSCHRILLFADSVVVASAIVVTGLLTALVTLAGLAVLAFAITNILALEPGRIVLSLVIGLAAAATACLMRAFIRRTWSPVRSRGA